MKKNLTKNMEIVEIMKHYAHDYRNRKTLSMGNYQPM